MQKRSPQIFAETLVPKKSSCFSCCKKSRPAHDKQDEEENEFATFCGYKRRLVCGNIYFPPRRTHNSQQSYANILTPIVIVLQILSIVSIWFANNFHVYLHSNLQMLLYTIVGSGILCFITIVLQSLCILSWWRSCTCLHRDFMGDFEEAEQNYYIGFKAAQEIDHGHPNIAYFSAVSPFPLEDEQQDVSSMLIESQDTITDPTHVDDNDFRFGRNTAGSKRDSKRPSEQDLLATARYIDQQNSMFAVNIDRQRKAKSMGTMSETAPLFHCCCNGKQDWYMD